MCATRQRGKCNVFLLGHSAIPHRSKPLLAVLVEPNAVEMQNYLENVVCFACNVLDA